MPFLRSAWYVAALPREISRDPLRRVVLEEPVVLFRGENGAAVALGDVCPHRFAPLSRGRLCGDEIECPYHGLRFDIHGRCTRNPNGNRVVPPGARLRAYPLIERYGLAWIWMGEAARADPECIPDYSELERRRMICGYTPVEANYELLNDNIMDEGAHIDFVHRSFRPAGAYARRGTYREEGDRIHSEGWWLDCELNEFMKPLWPGVARGDIYNFVHWHPPSNVLLEAGLRVGGALDPGPLGPAAHFFTPATASRTHYFWVTSHNRGANDREYDEFVRSIAKNAFEREDQPIIEAIESNMAGRDFNSLEPLSFSSDGAALAVRRTLARLIEAERAVRARA
jgi:phenylpropionate dioxygenase-like ring-hydroxylating dioxygenase large terminal subunit